MNDSGDIVIRNEDDAVAVLEQLVSGLALGPGVRLVLDGWPVFVIKIEGKDFHGTVPTRIMPSLLTLQAEIHRLYCVLRYGQDNLRKLTQEDRDRLEIVVRLTVDHPGTKPCFKTPWLKHCKTP